VNCPLCQGDVEKLMSTFAVGTPDNNLHYSPIF
jgi:hypothetical protein